MRHILFIVFFLFCGTWSLSQPLAKPEFRLGPLSAGQTGDLRLCGITEYSEFKLIVRGNYSGDGTRYSVGVYDSSNRAISFHPHKFIIPESDRMSFVETALIDGQTWLFLSRFSAAEKANILSAYHITDQGIRIETEKEIDRMPAFNAGNTGKFRINVSPDHKQLVVVREFPIDKTKNESIAIHHYDSTLKQQWTKTHVFNIPAKNTALNIPYINNKGDIFVIKKDRDKEQYKYSVIAVDHASRHFIEKPLNLGGIFISDIRAALLHNGNFVLSGFYSVQSYDLYEGYFYFAFDPMGAIVAKHNEPINSEILGQIIPKKDAAKSGASLSGFSLHHLIPQENGGLYLIAERSTQITDKGVERYMYEELLIMNFDASGNCKWGKGIKKKQETWGDNGKWSSYNFWLHNDTLNLIVNKVVYDDQLSKTGKKKKADEFGEGTGYGAQWFRIHPDATIFYLPLIHLFPKDLSVPLSINPELLYQDKNGVVFLIAEGHLQQHHALTGMQFYRKKQ